MEKQHIETHTHAQSYCNHQAINNHNDCLNSKYWRRGVGKGEGASGEPNAIFKIMIAAVERHHYAQQTFNPGLSLRYS